MNSKLAHLTVAGQIASSSRLLTKHLQIKLIVCILFIKTPCNYK